MEWRSALHGASSSGYKSAAGSRTEDTALHRSASEVCKWGRSRKAPFYPPLAVHAGPGQLQFFFSDLKIKTNKICPTEELPILGHCSGEEHQGEAGTHLEDPGQCHSGRPLLDRTAQPAQELFHL